MTGFQDRLRAFVSQHKPSGSYNPTGKTGKRHENAVGSADLKSTGPGSVKAPFADRAIKAEHAEKQRLRKDVQVVYDAADREIGKLVFCVIQRDPTGATSACREFESILHPLVKKNDKNRPNDVQLQGNLLAKWTSSKSLTELKALSSYMDVYLLESAPKTGVPSPIILHLAFAIKSAILDRNLQQMEQQNAGLGKASAPDFLDVTARQQESSQLAIILNEAAKAYPDSAAGMVSGMHFSRNDLGKIASRLSGGTAKSTLPSRPMGSAAVTTATVATAKPARAPVWVTAKEPAVPAQVRVLAATRANQAQVRAQAQVQAAYRACTLIDQALASGQNLDAKAAMQQRHDYLQKAVNAMAMPELRALNTFLYGNMAGKLPLATADVLKQMAMLVKTKIFYERIGDFGDQGVDVGRDEFPDFGKLTAADRGEIIKLSRLASEIEKLSIANPGLLENSALQEIRQIWIKLGQYTETTATATATQAQRETADLDGTVRLLMVALADGDEPAAFRASVMIDQTLARGQNPSPKEAIDLRRNCLERLTSTMTLASLYDLNELLKINLAKNLDPALRNVLQHLAVVAKIEIFYERMDDFGDQGVDVGRDDFPDFSKLTVADRAEIIKLSRLASEIEQLSIANPGLLENSALEEIRQIWIKLGQYTGTTATATATPVNVDTADVDRWVARLVQAMKDGDASGADLASVMLDQTLAAGKNPSPKAAIELRRDCLVRLTNSMPLAELNVLNDTLKINRLRKAAPAMTDVIKHMAVLVKTEIFYRQINDFDEQGLDVGGSDSLDFSKLTDTQRTNIPKLRRLVLEVERWRGANPETLENSTMEDIRKIASKFAQYVATL